MFIKYLAPLAFLLASTAVSAGTGPQDWTDEAMASAATRDGVESHLQLADMQKALERAEEGDMRDCHTAWLLASFNKKGYLVESDVDASLDLCNTIREANEAREKEKAGESPALNHPTPASE